MKKLITAILFATSIQFAVAQEAITPATPVTPQQPTQEQRIEKRIERLKTEINLTDEQIPKIRAIYAEQESLKDKSPEERREASKLIQEKLNQVLTPEQIEKQKQLREERRKKMMEQRQKQMNEEVKDPAKIEPAKEGVKPEEAK